MAPVIAADIGAAVTKIATRPAEACSIAHDQSSSTPAPPTVPQKKRATQSGPVSDGIVVSEPWAAASPKSTMRPPIVAIGTIVVAR